MYAPTSAAAERDQLVAVGESVNKIEGALSWWRVAPGFPELLTAWIATGKVTPGLYKSGRVRPRRATYNKHLNLAARVEY